MNKNKKNQEIELKLDLKDSANYRKLTTLLPAGEELKQINYFFDSRNLFYRKNYWAIRIRKENKTHILTVKGPKKIIHDVVIRKELETILIQRDAEQLIKTGIYYDYFAKLPPLSFLKEIFPAQKSPLYCFLSFSNKRIVSKINNIVVELDHSIYNNSESFELEVEFKGLKDYQKIVNQLESFFLKHNLPWQISEKSKFVRALEDKNQIFL